MVELTSWYGNLGVGLTNSLLLLAAEADFLKSFFQTFWQYFLVAVGLGFVIFVHELGHFLAAKTFGVRCDKFYVGFDVPISIGPIKLPRTLGKFQWGETEYGIGIIPLGGYVKMLGQDDDPRKAEEEAERIRLAQVEGGQVELDPRSYPAKPVWQRMIIISAGVIMNLIFAVVMAGVAYEAGVLYTPTLIGGVTSGGPAWQTDIRPGDQIMRIDGMQKDEPYWRFNDFLMTVAVRSFDKGKEPLSLALDRFGERRDFTVEPTNELDSSKRRYMIGISGSLGMQIHPEQAFLSASELESSNLDIRPGDRIVAVDGRELPIDERFGQATSVSLSEALEAKWNQPVELKLSRAEADAPPSTVTVQLPPQKVRTFGLGFRPGPIIAFSKNSVAEAAGLQLGDIPYKIDGVEIVNSWRLPNILAARKGEEIEFSILRGGYDGEVVTVRITVGHEVRFPLISPVGGSLTLQGLGLAYRSSAMLSQLPTSSGNEDANARVGDKLVQVRIDPTDAQRKQMEEIGFLESAFKELPVDEVHTTDSLYEQLQNVPIGIAIKCYFDRNGETVESTFKIESQTDWYWPWEFRGLNLQSLQRMHYANSFPDAVALGLTETWKRFTEVLYQLKILVTGKVGMDGFGGPIKIFQVAGAEASHGISRLLLFLTFLSANLAILNFLPIPALDGGHMMFLTAEAVLGRPINEAMQVRLTMFGVICLLSLMGFVIIKDLLDFF